DRFAACRSSLGHDSRPSGRHARRRASSACRSRRSSPQATRRGRSENADRSRSVRPQRSAGALAAAPAFAAPCMPINIDFGIVRRIRQFSRRWAFKRHGMDPDPVTLPSRRIYIIPTGLGVAFALMLLAMFIGAMNYANNLALGLTFLLGSLALTAMHYCHRNLSGLVIRSAASEPVFAGGIAKFHIALENSAPLARHELTVANDHGMAQPQPVPANGRAVFELQLPAPKRGLLTLDHFEAVTRHPFGL